jgi:hypothetical protein
MFKSVVENKPNTEESQLRVTIDNGDFELIKSMLEAYSFKDHDSLFKFAIAALLDGFNNEGLYTIKNDKVKGRYLSKIEPSSDLVVTND